ncbi:hypothetical protein [Chryseobacterium sp. CT-SW4]|uniref:hypothetical protein n=1 Tax=Chryseobacterium sp. SW-1 TaxID=3157343 RepID=UPI003B01D471
MNVNFNEISEESFTKLNYNFLFENKLSERAFGVISNDNYFYKFSWQSDTIKPEILTIKETFCTVGIDLNYAILDFIKNCVILNIDLNSFFIKSLVHNEIIYVISETEIYLVSVQNFNVLQTIDLPDIFEEIIFESDKIIIKYYDGEISI